MSKLVRWYHQARMVEQEIENILSGNQTHFNNRTDVSTIDNYLLSVPFINGRERGFCFFTNANDNPHTGRRTCVFISNCRNTDGIKLTIGHDHEWETVTEDEYKASEYYEEKEYYKVAIRVITLCGGYCKDYGMCSLPL